MNGANNETQVANEVARYATVDQNPSTKTLAQWGKSQLDSHLTGQTVCIRFPTKTSNIGDPVEVTIKGGLTPRPPAGFAARAGGCRRF